jgi:diacylglycerol kinase
MGFKYAGEGLLYALRTQRNFRFHLVMAIVVVLAGYWLQLSYAAWAVLMLTIGFVVVTEMVNTAAETLVDMVSPDYHPLAKQVKDLAAGAVLVTAIVAVGVGPMILGPPLLALLR